MPQDHSFRPAPASCVSAPGANNSLTTLKLRAGFVVLICRLGHGTHVMNFPSATRLATTLLVALPLSLPAQVIDLTVNNTGVALGDKPRMNGLRINYRDRRLEEVNGVNLTIWSPYEPATGTVNGLALGLPATGARRINGVGIGIL